MGSAAAHPIDVATATGTYSGGGVTLTADDLRSIVGDDGGTRGSGQAFVVECNGLFGYSTIQSAIDDAAAGDVVIVLPNDCTPEGRWFEHIDFLGKAIRVQSANPADDDVVNATIIDGSNAGSVVRFVNGETSASVLDGLRITNGRGIDAVARGGGISCDHSGPTIRRCIVSGNAPSVGMSLWARECDGLTVEQCSISEVDGLPIYTLLSRNLSFASCGFQYQGGSPMIMILEAGGEECGESEQCASFESCHFINSTASVFINGNNQTGIRLSDCEFGNLTGTAVAGGQLQIEDCRFQHISSEGSIIAAWGSAEITNTVIAGNLSEEADVVDVGGGLTMSGCTLFGNETPWNSIVDVRTHAFVADTDFANNSCARAPLFVQVVSPSVIENCSFAYNTGGSTAAAIMAQSSAGRSTIRDCRVIGNESPFLGTTIRGLRIDLVDSLIAGNITSGTGGAVFLHDGEVQGCTIVGNRIGSGAGGVYSSRVSNSIVYDNRVADSDGTHVQIAQSSSVRFSDVQNLGVVPAAQVIVVDYEGSFDAPPLFAEPGEWDDMGTPEDYSDDVYTLGDYHLQAGSPCIDAGDPMFEPAEGATDLDGQPRLMGCRVDVGVDEFWQMGTSIPGDFNDDQAVNIFDLPGFVDEVLEPGGLGLCTADINTDGRVDGRDVGEMVALLTGS